MGQRGFSLVELVIVVAIMATLLSIATLEFNRWTRKEAINKQTRELYVDLMEVRKQAMYEKRERTVEITASAPYIFKVYSSAKTTVSPVDQKTLLYPVTVNTTPKVTFDTQGLTGNSMSICVDPSDNPGTIDSLVISTARIKMGKRKEGKDCASDNITLK